MFLVPDKKIKNKDTRLGGIFTEGAVKAVEVEALWKWGVEDEADQIQVLVPVIKRW